MVTELGYQDFGLNGLITSHQVGIWRLSDQVLIGSAVVPGGTSGTLDGHFRYASLASPTTLASGVTYVISGFDNGQDPHVWDEEIGGYPNGDVSGFSVNPAITINGAHGPWQSSFGFPSSYSIIGDARTVLMGPNFKFNPVPAPGAIALLGLGAGLVGWIRRRRATNKG